MKIYCNVCNKYRKSRKSKILFIFQKNIKSVYFLQKVAYYFTTREYEKVFKEEESIEILKNLGLITNIKEYQKRVSEENITQEVRLKNIDETRNYLIEEINENKLMIKKHKKIYRVLNYI